MDQGSSPVIAFLSFWMFLYLAVSIVLILGGIYALYCFGRAAAGMDRLASAVEEWVQMQKPDNSVYIPPEPVEPLESPTPPAPPAPTSSTETNL